ncbi:high affinity copper uptake protein 1 isoform X1 [Leptinotarsa decemlineata]|uniref:high affinity copper uptake protein 1 isoform X1 n=2 Tax=Leptinotarsa decemlineata TaxID=7539 RepID=UPI003D30896C
MIYQLWHTIFFTVPFLVDNMEYTQHMYQPNTMNHSPHAKLNMGHMSCKDMMMPMCFFFSEEAPAVLFKGWKFDSVGGLIGSMIGIFLMAALYEGLKYLREYIFSRTKTPLQHGSAASSGAANTTNGSQAVRPIMIMMHFLQVFLHMIQIVLSYFLMLIFMSYNTYLCLAIVFGGGMGYFLFGWKKYVTVDNKQHCR